MSEIVGREAPVLLLDAKIASWLWKNLQLEERALRARSAGKEVSDALELWHQIDIAWRTAHPLGEPSGSPTESSGRVVVPKARPKRPSEPWLSCRAAASLVERSPRWISDLAKRGVLDHRPGPRCLLVSTDSVWQHFAMSD